MATFVQRAVGISLVMACLLGGCKKGSDSAPPAEGGSIAPEPPPPTTWSGWDGLQTIAIVGQDDPTNHFLQQAAQELQTYLGSMSGRTWSVQSSDIQDPAIRLDVNAALPEFAGRNDEAVKILADPDGIRITGKTPIAARHGAYLLLEKLGVRWFFKHSAWEVVPDTLADPGPFSELHEPDFLYRRIWHPVSVDNDRFARWKARNRLDGAASYEVRHSYADIAPASEYAAHPDWFLPEGGPPLQLKPDHPDIVDRAIAYARGQLAAANTSSWDSLDRLPPGAVPISPNDGLGWSPPYNESTDWQIITDKVFYLANEVAKNVQNDFPGQYVSVYSYSLYAGIPTSPLEPNLLVQIATSFDKTPLSFTERVEGLAAKGVALGIRDYYDVNVWYRDYPPQDFYKLLRAIPWYAARNVKVYNAEAGDGWGARGLLYYAAGKLYWDPGADVNALLQDFYQKAFGPAAPVMGRFYERWLGGQKVNHRTLALAFQDLSEAEALAAGNAAVLERLRHVAYWMRHVWLWYRRGLWDTDAIGNLTLQETKDYYEFLFRTRSLYTVFHRYIESNIRRDLELRGLSQAEITGLQNTTAPSAPQAQTWLDEALMFYAGTDPVDVVSIDPYATNLAPLNRPDLPTYTPGRRRGSSVVIPSSGNESVTIQVRGTGSFSWIGPDGFERSSATVDNPTLSPIQFAATDPGLYTLRSSRSSFIDALDVPGRPAAILADEQTIVWFLSPFTGYFFVPAGTPGFLLGASGTTDRPRTYDLTDPNGVTSAFVMTQTDQIPVQAPAPGVWRLHARATADSFDVQFSLTGVSPLLWHNPQWLPIPTQGSP
ncbi:MAG: DUF4838 domain-containing protein [Planctomycetes bacterium]|nr:DUF4838 domain-containing protein [Planctomycetota bacterium]